MQAPRGQGWAQGTCRCATGTGADSGQGPGSPRSWPGQNPGPDPGGEAEGWARLSSRAGSGGQGERGPPQNSAAAGRVSSLRAGWPALVFQGALQDQSLGSSTQEATPLLNEHMRAGGTG